MVKSKFLALAVIALALLILAPTAMAKSAKTPPTLQDILGTYDVKLKYSGYDVGPVAYKGSRRAEFYIEESMGPGDVHLTWYSDVGASWEYEAFYDNGILTFATSDVAADLPEWIEMMVAQFSGSGSKVKMTGNFFIYDISGGYAEVDPFSAKKQLCK